MQLSFLSRRPATLAILTVCTMLATGCGRRKQAEQQRLLVYVPCGMEMPFMELEKLFESRNPGVDVQLLLDAAHIIAQRVVEKGETPDVVVSPGGVELEPLLAAGCVVKEDMAVFGQYELMLFVPRANAAQVSSIEDLTRDSVRTIAVADPEKTSIGRYTRDGLKALGIWDRIEPKVVVTGDASMTYKHVASSKADASFAYRSCPLKTAPDKIEYSKVSVLSPMPADSYGPAYATAAVMKDSVHRELAQEFVALLLAEDGQALLKKFDVPSLTSGRTAE